MSSPGALALLAAQRQLPPGTEPAFPPADIAKKELAVRSHCGTDAAWTGHRARPEGYVAKKYEAPPSLPLPPPTEVLDRCIPAWPDPYVANIRPYFPGTRAAGTCNSPLTWGLPYKSARGIRFPPPYGPNVTRNR